MPPHFCRQISLYLRNKIKNTSATSTTPSTPATSEHAGLLVSLLKRRTYAYMCIHAFSWRHMRHFLLFQVRGEEEEEEEGGREMGVIA